MESMISIYKHNVRTEFLGVMITLLLWLILFFVAGSGVSNS